MDLKPGTKVKVQRFGVVVVEEMPFTGPAPEGRPQFAGRTTEESVASNGSIINAGWRCYFGAEHVIEVL